MEPEMETEWLACACMPWWQHERQARENCSHSESLLPLHAVAWPANDRHYAVAWPANDRHYVHSHKLDSEGASRTADKTRDVRVYCDFVLVNSWQEWCRHRWL
eukprot:COSAG02_NODE_5788_length_4033_cov_5.314692_1_plen_103_part_00